MSRSLDRRSFLRSALLGAACLACPPAAWGRAWDGKLIPGRLHLVNLHTGEDQKFLYRDETGEYDLQALEGINHLLRCHYTDEVKEFDLNTLEYLNLLDHRLGGNREIHVISAYRSPAYNERLRQHDRSVASKSLHLLGKAIDLRIPGVKLKSLRRTAVDLRFGGVGYYPRSDFVHIDSGDFRTW